MIATATQMDTSAMRAHLNQIQTSIGSLKQSIEQTEARRERDAADARDWFSRCNQTYDVVSPMAKHHDHWLHIGNTCRTVGKVATFAMPVAMMAFIGLGHNPVAGVALLADLAVIGATMFGVQKSRVITEREGPKVDRLIGEWKFYQERMDRSNSSANSAKLEIGRLESDLHKKEGEAQVIEMALAMPVTPVSSGTIVREDDAIQIGNLRIPRRVTQ